MDVASDPIDDPMEGNGTSFACGSIPPTPRSEQDESLAPTGASQLARCVAAPLAAREGVTAGGAERCR